MITKYSELNHIDAITINKLKYVEDESLFTGIHANKDKVKFKHLYNIKRYSCIGEYSLNTDKICLFNDGLKHFCKLNKRTVEKQITNTISHEIMHRVLFYEHGEYICRDLDNIAPDLKKYGVY